MSANMPFHVNPELTGIALAYRNTGYIADEILPRVPVSQKSFQYKKYDNSAFLNIPNSEIGRKGLPETMELKSELLTESCVDHSVMAEVPEDDVLEANAASGTEKEDPIGDNTLLATEGLKLAREKRVADLITNSATYDGNVVTLSGSDRFTDKTSSFLDTYYEVIEKMIMEPNYAVVSSIGARYLQRHPDFLSIYKSDNPDNKGQVPLDFIAKELGLEKILVGKSKANAQKPGKTPVIQTLWGVDLALFYLNPIARPKYGLTFGLTATKGSTEVQTYFEGKFGAHGVHYIKPVETLKELIMAPACGFLIKNAFDNTPATKN